MTTTNSAANRQTIAEHYKRLIETGKLVDGAPLPPVVDIAQEHGVSKDVVTRAFRLLQGDGLIRVGRKGAIVCSSVACSFDRQATSAPGIKVVPTSDRVRVVAAGLVPAPEYVAGELDVEPLNAVIRRAYVRLRDHLPVLYTVSWLLPELVKTAPGLVSLDSVEYTGELLRQATGRPIARGVDQVYARGATADVGRELGVGEGAPLLAGCTRSLDDAGRIVEFGEFFVPADQRLTFSYNVE